MNKVLVGVDASDASVDAVRRAAEEARFRGATLEVLHAFHPPEQVAAFPALPEKGKDKADPDKAQAEADASLAAWLDKIDVDLEGLEVTRSAVADHRPAMALVDRSKDAELVVVGSRGRGGFAGLRLGSVSEQVARHAHCPVLVTRHQG